MTDTPTKAHGKTRAIIKNLLLRALRIEDAIRREHRKRLPDSFRLLHMKKLRLVIKDRLQRLVKNRHSNSLATQGEV